MLRPSYTDLLEVINKSNDDSAVTSSRYSIVIAAAKRAMTIAMKCVIALPGSFSLNFIESSPIKICNMI